MTSKPEASVLVPRIYSWLVCAAAWEILAHLYKKPMLFPSFEQILFESLPQFTLFDPNAPPGMLGVGEIILKNSAQTLKRIAGGFVLGSFGGLFFAVTAYLLGTSRLLSRILLGMSRSIPLLALIPLFMFWFGDREFGMYLYISFGVFIIVSAVTYEGFSNIPPQYIQQATLLGGSRFRRLWMVEIPAIQPQLLASFREALGTSWAFSLGAEYLTANSGLGYLASQSYLYSDMGKLFIVASIYCVYAYVTYLATDHITQRLGMWYLPATK
jgi:sulfonate transport system permease protein